jgi:hypothetical protein
MALIPIFARTSSLQENKQKIKKKSFSCRFNGWRAPQGSGWRSPVLRWWAKFGKIYIVHSLKHRTLLFNTDRIGHLYQGRHEKNVRFFLHHGDMTLRRRAI